MRDARCVASAARQFADQSDDHRDDSSAEVNDRPYVISWQEIQSREYRKMAVKLGVGPQRYLETADELGRCPQRIALRNVGWYGEGCPTDLVDEREVPAQWSFEGQQVGLVGELLRGAPRIESLELLHGAKRTTDHCGSRNRTVSPRSAFTHPASRLPHLAARAAPWGRGCSGARRARGSPRPPGWSRTIPTAPWSRSPR